MTFESRELSLSDGKPVRLYEFERGLNTWRYCSGDRDQIILGQAWTRLQISDGGVRQSDDPDADMMTVELPADVPIVQLYRGTPPGGELKLTVYTMHAGESDVETVWTGTVYDVRRRGLDRAEVVGGTLDNSMGATGLRLGWQRPCPHATYDHWCRANRDDFRTDTVVLSHTGLKITSTAFAAFVDGWFKGGFIEWESIPGVTDRRFVLDHVGAELSLLGGTFGLADGTPIKAFAGDDKTWETCGSKFNNRDNYGGFPALTGKSPFDGNPVF